MGFLQRVKRHFIPGNDNAYRPHLLRKPYLIALLLAALASEGVLMANLLSRESGAPLLAAVVRSDVIALTNAQRQEIGVGKLNENSLLDAAAQAKAVDMAGRGYFAHVGPDGKRPWDWILQTGYDYHYAGENLAVRFVDSRDVVEAWMASPSHRANMVKPAYTEIGIGVAHGTYQGSPATFVVEYFGTPSASALAARAQGAVLGAMTQAPSQTLDSLTRGFVRVFADPRGNASWILGGVSLLLLLALGFAFFHHIQIQAQDLLAPGAVVAAIALGFLALNTTYLAPSARPAAVAQAEGGWSVEIAEGGAATLR